MSTATSYATSPTSSRYLSSKAPFTQTPHNAQKSTASVPVPSYAVAAEADAPLNLGLDEDEVVWGGESVGLGFGLLSRIKEKTNALLEEIDWDCRLCGNTATEPCVTRCGHLFCWSHLTKHLSSSPRCPTCTTPLAIDRDVVQVFGRPKVIPSDAPWTSVNHTPGSRGSAADQSAYEKKGFNATNQLSPSIEGKENYDFSAPPPPASPIDTRVPHSRSSRLESSRTSSFEQLQKRRPLKPFTLIQRPHSCGSSSQEKLHNSKPPVDLVVTHASSGSSSSLDLNGREETEDNAWSAWRRASESTTVVATRRPSQFVRRMTDSPTLVEQSLRPPSPQLRTRAFRPGWANAKRKRQNEPEKNASTDSLDIDLRRSMEVRFTRGLSFEDSDVGNGEEGSDAERDPIYLHSPTKKLVPLGVPPSSLLFSNEEIHKPVPRYAFDADTHKGPMGRHPAERGDVDQPWYMGNHQYSAGEGGPQSTSKRKETSHPSDFARLKAAVAEGRDSGSFITDPLGRAMCVFAAVLLVKILLKST